MYACIYIYIFKVYDNLNAGYITRSEMVKLLKVTILARKVDAEDIASVSKMNIYF